MFINHFLHGALDTGTAGPDTDGPPLSGRALPGLVKDTRGGQGISGGLGVQGLWLKCPQGFQKQPSGLRALVSTSNGHAHPRKTPEGLGGQSGDWAIDRLVPPAATPNPSGHPNQERGSCPCCQPPRDRVLQSHLPCSSRLPCLRSCQPRSPPGPWILEDLPAGRLSQIHPTALTARAFPIRVRLALTPALNPARLSSACCTKPPF